MNKAQMKTKVVKDLNDKEVKNLKRLCRGATGEILKMYKDHIVIYGVIGKRIVSMCCISSFSPEYHFDNENEEEKTIVPYLYNYICDYKYRKFKVSVQLMLFVKKYILDSEYYTNKAINLDIIKDNSNAKNFFEKNDFDECGCYEINALKKKEYISYQFNYSF